MCAVAATKEMLERADTCKVHGCTDSYAASQSLLDNMILPSVTTDSMMYTSDEPAERCSAGCDEVRSTILSVVGSRKNTRLVVHIVDVHGPDPYTLMSTTESASGSISCVVVSVGDLRMRQDQQDMDVYVSSSGEHRRMNEPDIMRMISRVSGTCETLIWYWTLDALGYGAILNQGETVHWAITLFPDVQLHSPLCGVEPNPSGTSHPIRVLPFFYTSHRSPTVAVMGRGFSTAMRGDDLKVELLALSRLAISRVYGSRASTGRCFCCQYIVNLHNKYHQEEPDSQDRKLTLRLEKGFQQRMRR